MNVSIRTTMTGVATAVLFAVSSLVVTLPAIARDWHHGGIHHAYHHGWHHGYGYSSGYVGPYGGGYYAPGYYDPGYYNPPPVVYGPRNRRRRESAGRKYRCRHSVTAAEVK